METSRHEILNHLRKARRNVESMPPWKQAVLAAGLPEAPDPLPEITEELTDENFETRAT